MSSTTILVVFTRLSLVSLFKKETIERYNPIFLSGRLAGAESLFQTRRPELIESIINRYVVGFFFFCLARSLPLSVYIHTERRIHTTILVLIRVERKFGLFSSFSRTSRPTSFSLSSPHLIFTCACVCKHVYSLTNFFSARLHCVTR